MKYFSPSLVKIICMMLGAMNCLSACVYVTDQPIIFDPSTENNSVIIQDQAKLWLGFWEENLYIYPIYHPHVFGSAAQYLSRLEPGKLSRVSRLSVAGETSSDMTTIAGQIGSELYFFSSADQMCSLHKIDLVTGKTALVWSGQSSISRNDIRIEGNELWLRLFNDGIQGDYLHVREGHAHVISNMLRPYSLGGKEYILDFKTGSDPHVLFREKGGEWMDTGLKCGSKSSLITTPYGLLVHNKAYANSGEQALYYIQPTGEIVELFSFPCLYSVSAINIFREKLIFSVKRYEEYDEIGMKRYQNDEIEGSYIISLTELTVEKVDDMVFDGLYIFDDSGILACDEDCNIYKLDCNGNVIDILLESKPRN